RAPRRRAPCSRHDRIGAPARARVDVPARPGSRRRTRDLGGGPGLPPGARVVLPTLRLSGADDVPARATQLAAGERRHGDRAQSARLTKRQYRATTGFAARTARGTESIPGSKTGVRRP